MRERESVCECTVKPGTFALLHTKLLHYITLHYTKLHCITIHYTTPHCITLHRSSTLPNEAQTSATSRWRWTRQASSPSLRSGRNSGVAALTLPPRRTLSQSAQLVSRECVCVHVSYKCTYICVTESTCVYIPHRHNGGQLRFQAQAPRARA
jgi:hypothetical protein